MVALIGGIYSHMLVAHLVAAGVQLDGWMGWSTKALLRQLE